MSQKKSNASSLSRRNILQASGVVAFAGAGVYPSAQPGAASREMSSSLGERLLVEARIDYSPRSIYPVIHWDGFPEYLVNERSNEVKLSVFVSPTQTETFRNNQRILSSIDVTGEYRYSPVRGNPPLIHEKSEVVLGPNKSAKIESHPALPGKIVDQGNGEVTAVVGGNKNELPPGQSESIELEPQKAVHNNGGVTKSDSVVPTLTVHNYGQVDVFASSEN